MPSVRIYTNLSNNPRISKLPNKVDFYFSYCDHRGQAKHLNFQGKSVFQNKNQNGPQDVPALHFVRGITFILVFTNNCWSAQSVGKGFQSTNTRKNIVRRTVTQAVIMFKAAYNLLFKRSSTFALVILVGSFFFERASDMATDAIFENVNKGKLWKDMKHKYET